MTDNPGGVRLSGVRGGSPAEKAGLKAGDIIVKIGDHEVADLQGMTDALRVLPARRRRSTSWSSATARNQTVKVDPGPPRRAEPMAIVLDADRRSSPRCAAPSRGMPARQELLQLAADRIRAAGPPYTSVYLYMLHGDGAGARGVQRAARRITPASRSARACAAPPWPPARTRTCGDVRARRELPRLQPRDALGAGGPDPARRPHPRPDRRGQRCRGPVHAGGAVRRCSRWPTRWRCSCSRVSWRREGSGLVLGPVPRSRSRHGHRFPDRQVRDDPRRACWRAASLRRAICEPEPASWRRWRSAWSHHRAT